MDKKKTGRDSLKKTLNKIVNSFDGIDLNEDDKNELDEWISCKEDFFYFLRKYVQLDLPGFDNEFVFHNGQELVVRTLIESNFAVCLKSRQIGITTVIRAYCAWLTIFFNNYSIGIISKKGPDATAFIRKTILLIDNLPKFLRPTFKKKTEQQYVLANGSIAMAEAVSPSQPENTLRSNPITFLIIDEGAFIHKIEEALVGLLPTTVTVQRAAEKAGIPYGILVISTANKTKGVGKWFFELYRDALMNNSTVKKKKTYKAIRLHWKDLDGPFDQDWYDMQCTVQGYKEDNIAQEIDCVFLPDVKNGIIDPENVIGLYKNQRKPEKVVHEIGGDIYIFDKDLEETRESRRFVISVDTATSLGFKTFSSIVAIDYETNEQVLEYMGKLSTHKYPDVIKKCCELLGENIFIIIERNTIGESIIGVIEEDPRFSAKLLKTIVRDKSGKVMKTFTGIETNPKTKPLFMEAVSEFFNENVLNIYGERTIMQIGSCEVVDGKLLGTPNDLVMAYSFIAYTKKNNLIKFNDKNAHIEQVYFDSPLGDMTESEMLKYLYDKDNLTMLHKISNHKKSPNALEYLNDD